MQPYSLSVNETARALGIGRTKTYDLINGAKLKAIKIGRRTLVTSASIEALVNGEQQ